MDKIYECANNFKKLITIKYNFIISQKRITKKITLDFKEDFRHAVGIVADYFIEAVSKIRNSTVYIFIRKREENDNYVVVSFLKKYNVFIGIATYWMLKEKIVNNQSILLYKHPGYRG